MALTQVLSILCLLLCIEISRGEETKDCLKVEDYVNITAISFGHVIKSTCPGYYVMNYDENRKPKAIAEVWCACSTCITDTGNKCEKMTNLRHMQRRKDKSGTFKTVLESVSIGCTCLRSNVTVVSGPKPES